MVCLTARLRQHATLFSFLHLPNTLLRDRIVVPAGGPWKLHGPTRRLRWESVGRGVGAQPFVQANDPSVVTMRRDRSESRIDEGGNEAAALVQDQGPEARLFSIPLMTLHH